jgi:hypothetical protein
MRSGGHAAALAYPRPRSTSDTTGACTPLPPPRAGHTAALHIMVCDPELVQVGPTKMCYVRSIVGLVEDPELCMVAARVRGGGEELAHTKSAVTCFCASSSTLGQRCISEPIAALGDARHTLANYGADAGAAGPIGPGRLRDVSWRCVAALCEKWPGRYLELTATTLRKCNNYRTLFVWTQRGTHARRSRILQLPHLCEPVQGLCSHAQVNERTARILTHAMCSYPTLLACSRGRPRVPPTSVARGQRARQQLRSWSSVDRHPTRRPSVYVSV